MDDALATQLLASIDTNRLVVLSGAGVSMSPPSGVPAARTLANQVVDKYRRDYGSNALDAIQDDLAAVATYFFGRNELIPLFIRSLIDWVPFRRTPNRGHACIADFLGGRIFELAVTTNLDELTELAARHLGEHDFRSATSGQEAAQGGQKHAPYLKVHGCVRRDMDTTLWCVPQLGAGQPLAAKVADSKQWLLGNLRQRDILIVGFWTDWSYLNEVLAECLAPAQPTTVVLVDPATPADLEARAPSLWAWAHSGHFQHVSEDGATFLEDLRRRFSLNFLRRLVQQASATFQALGGGPYGGPPDFHAAAVTDDLFALRRDAEGLPAGQVPRAKRPDVTMNLVAVMQMLLMAHGAAVDGPSFVIGGRRVRIVRGAADALSLVKKRFLLEEATPEAIDIVVAAGAEPDGNAPANLVRDGVTPSIARPGPSGRWMTFAETRGELGL